MDTIKWLQEWYNYNCDGDWEHSNEIKIVNLDNPGWLVEVDIDENLERSFKEIKKDISDDNWLHCKVVQNKFIGAGGPKNLLEILELFKEWQQ